MVTTRSSSDGLESTPDHLVNPSNPLYLHPNENPTLVLVSTLLTEKNYHSWKHQMLAMLESKNKHKFVDGSFPSPSISDPLYESWRRCNRMVMAWLMRSMTSQIAESVVYFDTATAIWKDLSARFSHGNMFRIADLTEEIQQVRQGSLSVTQYFTKLQTLWKELEQYRTVLICKCSPTCSCGILEKIIKEREDECTIKFLRGLNEDFAHTRSQIMIIAPMPPLSRVFSLILQHEREFGSITSQNIFNTPSCNAVTQIPSQNTQYARGSSNIRGNFQNNRGGGRTPSGGRGRGNRYCEQCGRTNHTKDTCFQIYGYPPGYKSKNNNTSASSSANMATLDPNANSQLTNSAENIFEDDWTS
ncbi:unnamed protein product [Cuscuta epithymum]|uniref:Retrotransposon Copia-like N-terminal domain-containing protein n=1 Tax=Cuscuta epithymum TaxID=186058 RepID=A0AAV0CP33_9ASTE|nr:unnamed protein product [Cuscuta epithymum]CAH9147788.1 unnamed protein product [Cuscuta epithymum]